MVRPNKEENAQTFLKLADVLRDRRLAQVETLGSSGETECFSNSQGRFHVFKVDPTF